MGADDGRQTGRRSLHQERVRRYQATNGREGAVWNGAPVLLLTTRGRRTGRLHTTPLVYGRDGERYLLVASRRGADEHPQWYRNLTEHPEIEVQVLDITFRAMARTATDDEKPGLWQKMVEVWPEYDDYQAKTERVIPLVIVERLRPPRSGPPRGRG